MVGVLLQALAKLPWLEHSGEALSWRLTEVFLALHGHQLDYLPKAVVALVRDAASGAFGVAGLARQLRTCTVG